MKLIFNRDSLAVQNGVVIGRNCLRYSLNGFFIEQDSENLLAHKNYSLFNFTQNPPFSIASGQINKTVLENVDQVYKSTAMRLTTQTAGYGFYFQKITLPGIPLGDRTFTLSGKVRLSLNTNTYNSVLPYTLYFISNPNNILTPQNEGEINFSNINLTKYFQKYYFTLKFKSNITSNDIYIILSGNNQVLNGGIEFSELQLEEKKYPTSFIPTFDISRKREKDILYITDYQNIFNSQEGSILISVNDLELNEERFLLALSSNFNFDINAFYIYSKNQELYFLTTDSLGAPHSVRCTNNSSSFNVIVTWETNNNLKIKKIYLNKELKQSSTTDKWPVFFANMIYIGSKYNSGFIDAYIKDLKFFDKSLTEDEIKKLII